MVVLLLVRFSEDILRRKFRGRIPGGARTTTTLTVTSDVLEWGKRHLKPLSGFLDAAIMLMREILDDEEVLICRDRFECVEELRRLIAERLCGERGEKGR